MKWVKIVGGVVAVGIVIVVVAVFVVLDRLDGIVAGAIESYGSRMTGTEVTVESVELHLREGRGTIRGLRVANPDGFSDRDAFQLGEITLDVDPGSLRSEPHVIEVLAVRELGVLYEVTAAGRRNIDVIRDNVQAYTASDAQEADVRNGGETEPAPLLVVESLTFARGDVEVDASALGLDPLTQELPSFALSDLGAPGGEPADAIARRAVERLARRVIESVARSELEKLVEEQLGDAVGEEARKLLEGLGP